MAVAPNCFLTMLEAAAGVVDAGLAVGTVDGVPEKQHRPRLEAAEVAELEQMRRQLQIGLVESALLVSAWSACSSARLCSWESPQARCAWDWDRW